MVNDAIGHARNVKSDILGIQDPLTLSAGITTILKTTLESQTASTSFQN